MRDQSPRSIKGEPVRLALADSCSISSKSVAPVSSRQRPQKVPPPRLLPLTRS